MQLRTIDKGLYQKRFKRVALGLAVSLALMALLFSTLLIALFAGDSLGDNANNTALNGAGVLLAAVLLVMVLRKLEARPYFAEVAYVWHLKQELNQISRRMNNIKAAAQQGNQQAMTILSFSYQGSKQLWQLDDNTLLMEELSLWQAELEALQLRFNVSVSKEHYQRALLQAF